MTLSDFLKRLTEEDKRKMIVFSDGEGWSNVWFKKTETSIIIYCEDNAIFSDDK